MSDIERVNEYVENFVIESGDEFEVVALERWGNTINATVDVISEDGQQIQERVTVNW